MSEHWGVPVVVDSLSGTGCAMGANKRARAAPDGYPMTSTGSLVADPAVAMDSFMQNEVEKLRKLVEFAKIAP